MTQPVVAVAGIAFDRAGRVLLVQRGRAPGAGKWTVPGGRVEMGETLVAACARELLEETNLQVAVGPLVTVVERITSDYHYVIFDYAVRVSAGELRAGEDAAAARWVTNDELATLPLTSGLEAVIAAARALDGPRGGSAGRDGDARGDDDDDSDRGAGETR